MKTRICYLAITLLMFTHTTYVEAMELNKQFVIKRGMTTEFEDGLIIKFIGHSHKSTHINGPKSPLIVYMSLAQGQLKEGRLQFNVSIGNAKTGVFEWGHYQFDINGYIYDLEMTMTVTTKN